MNRRTFIAKALATAMLVPIYGAMDIVSRELVGFIPVKQSIDAGGLE